MGRFFISYRRKDTPYAGWLSCLLGRQFGDDRLFIDVEDLRAGEDFERRIDEELESCDAMVVVIGPAWVDAGAGRGAARLHEPRDFVRREIERALARTKPIPVIPLLIGVKLRKADLPERIAAIGRRHWIEADDRTFRDGAQRLIRDLNALPPPPPPPDAPSCTLEPVSELSSTAQPEVAGRFAFLWLEPMLERGSFVLAVADRPARWVGTYNVPPGQRFAIKNSRGSMLPIEVLRPNEEPARTIHVWVRTNAANWQLPRLDPDLASSLMKDVERKLLG